ncbi:MAG: PaaI family thioesterase, partial [Alphaproteobacteria bacterium]
MRCAPSDTLSGGSMSDTPVRLVDINRMMEMVPHLSALGIRAERLDRDAAVLRLPYRKELVAYEDTGVLAGGAIYSLIDSASGMAVFARLGVFEPIATLDLRLDYLKPAQAGR